MLWICAVVTCVLVLPLPAEAARRQRLELGLVQIPLEGSPVDLVPADLNGDGLGDLVVALAFTRWDRISVSESVEMDDVDGLVEMMTVVPALADERKLVVLLGRPDGSFATYGESFDLPRDVLGLESGPPGAPVLALSDRGVEALRLAPTDERPSLRFEPLVEARPVFADSGVLLPRLELVGDLDGDAVADLLLPLAGGYAVHLWRNGGLEAVAASHVQLPPRGDLGRRVGHRMYPLPQRRDVDGDHLPDLVFEHPSAGWNRFWVARNLGGGRFDVPFEPLGGPWDADTQARREASADRGPVVVTVNADDAEEPPPERPESGASDLVYFGDVDGDGSAEYVVEREHREDDVGFRKELRQAKNPDFSYRIRPAARRSLEPLEESSAELETKGYAFALQAETPDSGRPLPFAGGFEDLNGDGRQDLVAVTLDFSLWQIVRVVATRSISIGLDFHVHCQQLDGTFREVRGTDLSGKFKIDFDDLSLGQLSQFQGDFDGDGRRDFVQIGRGRTVGIHRGDENCSYPPKPDLVVKLRDEPKNLALVRVEDFDSDGLSDLLVVQPQADAGDGTSVPVRLDLYSSRMAEAP